MTDPYVLEIPELQRMKICYNEDVQGGNIGELVYVLHDNAEAEELIVAVLEDDNTFRDPVKLVFDGRAFPFKIAEADLIEKIGAGAWEKAKERMKAIETLKRRYCSIHPDVPLNSWGCARCEMEGGRM